MKHSRRKITISDVARAAGVSVSTVSRVLNEKEDVASETFEKVQTVIRDLGYASSLAARGMRSQRTNVIGLIMPDVSSPYSIEIMRGVNQVIANLDYDLIIYTNGDIRKYATAAQERHFVALLNGSITDGVIVVAGATTSFPSGAPVVIIDPNIEEPDFPAIHSTNREGALAAMNYLTGLGHRRIAHIAGRLDLVSACQRLQGYKAGLEAAGLPFCEELVQTGDYTVETAEDLTHILLSLHNPPTAIFAANDMSAMGVYRAAETAGCRIPEDLSVIGFDNLSDTVVLSPPLTTVDQSVFEMGSIATRMIVKLVKGEPLEHSLHRIETRLIVRNSCSSPKI